MSALTLWRAQTPVMRGVLLMCASTVFFAVMHTAIRHATGSLHPFEVAFFRNVFGLAFLVPLIIGGGVAQMRTQRMGLHAFRGLLNVIAMLLFFSAVSFTPLAKVTALSFTAPIFTAALSVLILGETFRLRRWAAIIIGFIGMLIILRPGLAEVDAGSLMVVASALLWAVVMIIIKFLSRTETSVAITAWMAIFLSVYSLPPALMVWEWPTQADWFWLAFIGLSGSLAQVTLAQSLKETEPTAVLPFDFLKLIWAAILAAWLFGEIPDIYTWIGAAVIFTAGLYIAHRERTAQRASEPAH
ncbi:MAG: DMT family transporter [Pseudomonadota bacterium]